MQLPAVRDEQTRRNPKPWLEFARVYMDQTEAVYKAASLRKSGFRTRVAQRTVKLDTCSIDVWAVVARRATITAT